MYLFQMSDKSIIVPQIRRAGLISTIRDVFANFPTITRESVPVAEDTERYESERARNVHCGNVK